MSRENIDRFRKALDRFNSTGAIAVDHLAPDFQMHQASSILDTAGVFHGPDALRDSLHELQESFEDLRFEGERFIEAPSGEVVVFIRVRGRGRGSGAQMDNRIAWVLTFRGNQTTRMVVYEEQAEALEAVGLRE